MRCASPKPCCAPMVASVRSTIRSSVPCSISVLVSLVDIQKEYASVPLECQEVGQVSTCQCPLAGAFPGALQGCRWRIYRVTTLSDYRRRVGEFAYLGDAD